MIRVTANVDVDDLERGIEFYRDGIGLTLARRLFSGSTAEMRGASVVLYLGVKPTGSLPAPGSINARDYRRHWTPVHLDFIVESIEVAVERAQQAGATLEQGVENHGPWGKGAVLSDPFGNGFCLNEGWPDD